MHQCCLPFTQKSIHYPLTMLLFHQLLSTQECIEANYWPEILLIDKKKAKKQQNETNSIWTIKTINKQQSSVNPRPQKTYLELQSWGAQILKKIKSQIFRKIVQELWHVSHLNPLNWSDYCLCERPRRPRYKKKVQCVTISLSLCI